MKSFCTFVLTITRDMNTATITKTLQKVSQQPSNYSLGFRRITSLPTRVRHDINLACVLKGETNTQSMQNYLNGLSDIEFIEWLKQA